MFLEEDRAVYGNLDNMLQALDWLKKIDVQCEQFLKWLDKQYREIDQETNLYSLKLDTPIGGLDIQNYFERFEWDNSRYPKIGVLNNQIDNFADRLIDFDQQIKQS